MRTNSRRFESLSWCVFILLVVLAASPRAFAADAPILTISGAKWDPVTAYREQKIEGWRVLVNQKLLAETNLCDQTLKLLAAQLYQITRVVPSKPLERLRQIPFWVERADDQFPCICYHESSQWLREHGVNPEKAGGVELSNPANFLSWAKEQPWMALHELSHGYHAQFLGHDDQRILRCYEKAKAGGSYESVLRYNGQRGRHYAMNNQMEYFAESTEAFFGTNDFYPFVRAELKAHDPDIYAVLCDVWEIPAKDR
jgi:hypothetical protein